jgi:hypothetical protein
MAYGTIKVDNIIFTNGGSDQTVTVSGIVASTSGNLTVTGTISGGTVKGTYGSFTSLTGVTTSGTNANFQTITGAVGVYTTSVSGLAVNALTANIVSGVFASGTAAAPSITFTGNTAAGIYSPGTDQVAISTSGTSRLLIDASGNIGLGNTPVANTAISANRGAALPALIELAGNGNTSGASGFVFGQDGSGVGILFQRSNAAMSFSTNGTERMRLTAAGLLGLGTSSPGGKLDVRDAGTTIPALGAVGTGLNVLRTDGAIGLIIGYENTLGGSYIQAQFTAGIAVAYPLYLQPNGGNVGIGNTSPGGTLDIKAAASTAPLIVQGPSSEFARIDTSGRLLVGTSSAPTVGDPQYGLIRVQGNTSSASGFGLLSIGRGQAAASITSGSELGHIYYTANDGSPYASVSAYADGTSGANDYPGRLVFSTTADGASSPTERMRITNSGAVLFIKTVRDFTTEGIVLAQGATSGTDTSFVTNAGTVVTFSRGTNDGTIISLRQDGTEEGTISVSGTTISYNGAHLSRWSQLPGGATREEILRGTVLSNLDEMCGWGDEDNEQLNRMQVSDIEGDKNVSGVFQAWDDDDDTYTDDFYCAMTGDFIIRIAEGVTVERGDLLMSAGDGTAKPQADDIIRSKTIAKVTSTHVTCTYEDGSYCVPCVLMAC